MLKIIKENDTIKVQSDYNEKFIKLSKALGGKWASPYWCFVSENEEKVREICLKILVQKMMELQGMEFGKNRKIYFINKS